MIIQPLLAPKKGGTITKYLAVLPGFFLYSYYMGVIYAQKQWAIGKNQTEQ